MFTTGTMIKYNQQSLQPQSFSYSTTYHSLDTDMYDKFPICLWTDKISAF